MRQGPPQKPQTARRESCGNAGSVESVESQRQASHSFHEPLGNLANSGRDSHIPTAPATTQAAFALRSMAGASLPIGKPKAGFPLFPRAPWKSRQQRARFPHSHSSGDDASGLRPPLDGGRFATNNSQEVIVVDREK